MVCSICVGHLRDACTFRNMVLCASKYFTEYWDSKAKSIPIEKAHAENLHSVTEDMLIQSDGEDNKDAVFDLSHTHIEIKSEKKTKTKRKKIKSTKTKRKKKKIEVDNEYDSDVPISILLKKKLGSCEQVVETNEIKEIRNDVVDLKGILIKTAIIHDVKRVSERKRGMLTCHTVLRETTACPFRHHKSWFQCFFCSQDFVEMNQLRDHTLRAHSDVDSELKKLKRYPRSLQIEISNLECRNCHLNLTDVNEMRRHLGEIHNKVIYSECIADFKLDASPYSCHICKQEFHVFRTLTTHLNEHYANCICDVCGKSFLNTKRLKVHKRTHEAGNFECTVCGKVLKTKISRSNHMENAHSKRQMKCQICYKPMKHYNDRIKHMSEVHNITHKFQCPICGREYNIKHYLTTHIRQTHGHKNKKCSECAMAFITNHGLKKHMLKHTGEKPFSCTICGKSYARSYTLKEHMRAHENERFV
ncbi:unnamed protein product [Chilo suppressalis]|nr:unnamed protein product [Chilo suppressalis]